MYDLLLLGTIFIGLTFAALLFFTKSINRSAKQFLSGALVVVFLCVGRILAIDFQSGNYHHHRGRLPLQFSMALGPLIYFYVLKLTRRFKCPICPQTSVSVPLTYPNDCMALFQLRKVANVRLILILVEAGRLIGVWNKFPIFYLVD